MVLQVVVGGVGGLLHGVLLGVRLPALVVRRPHPTDGRTTLVEITDAGRELCAAATASVTAVDFGLVGLDEDQTEMLTSLLASVRHAAGDFA